MSKFDFRVSDTLYHSVSGILLRSNVTGMSVLSSRVREVGGEGVSVTDASVSHIMVNNTITQNTAMIYLMQPGGIRLKGQSNITASYNDVGYTAYGGILVGWQTGWETPTPDSTPPVFSVLNNHVHDFGLVPQ